MVLSRTESVRSPEILSNLKLCAAAVEVFKEAEAGEDGAVEAEALVGKCVRRDHLIVLLKLVDLSILVKRNLFAN
jgi:hypothetical protein